MKKLVIITSILATITLCQAAIYYVVPSGSTGNSIGGGHAIKVNGDDMPQQPVLDMRGAVQGRATSGRTILTFDGIKGDPGSQGAIGPQGSTGPTGSAATITIGTVTTLNPISSARVRNVGTATAAIFDIGIPQGTTGATGAGTGDMLASHNLSDLTDKSDARANLQLASAYSGITDIKTKTTFNAYSTAKASQLATQMAGKTDVLRFTAYSSHNHSASDIGNASAGTPVGTDLIGFLSNIYKKISLTNFLAWLQSNLTLPWTNIQTRPTTVAGFGITDAKTTTAFTPYSTNRQTELVRTNASISALQTAFANSTSCGGSTGKLCATLTTVVNSSSTGSQIPTALAVYTAIPTLTDSTSTTSSTIAASATAVKTVFDSMSTALRMSRAGATKAEKYGVICNGSTDTTVALQNAITDNISKALLLPGTGNCMVSATLNITGKIDIFGNGSIIRRTGNYGDTFLVSAADPTTTTIYGGSINDLTILHTGTPMTSGAGIHYKSAGNQLASNVNLTGLWGGYLLEGAGVTINGGLWATGNLYNVTTDDTSFVKAMPGVGADTQNYNLNISGIRQTADAYDKYVKNVFDIHNIDTFQVTNSYFGSYWGSCFNFVKDGSKSIVTILVSNSYCDGGTISRTMATGTPTAISATGSTAGGIYGPINFDHMFLSGANSMSYGVNLNSSTLNGFSLTNSDVLSFKKNGVVVNNGSNVTIEGNRIFGNNLDAGSYNGVTIANSLSNIFVTNNKIGMAAYFGGSQTLGLSVGTGVTGAFSPNLYGSYNTTPYSINSTWNPVVQTATGYSGNTTTVASTSGTLTTGKQITPDANGNLVASTYDVGASGGGSGTVNSGTANQLAYYATSTTAVSGTNALPNGTTATTQSAGDNSTKVATTAYADLKAVHPASSTANALVRWSGTGGTTLLDTANLTYDGATLALVTSDYSQNRTDTHTQLSMYNSQDGTNTNFINFNKARGGATPSATQATDALGTFSFRGHNGTSYTGTKARINVTASSNAWSGSENGTQILFSTTPLASTTLTDALTITSFGNLRLGSNGEVTGGTPPTRTLAINSGTPPTSNAADTALLYSADVGGVAGKAGLHIRSEDGSVTSIGANITSPGQFISTLTTGTAPLVVTSTTPVTNLSIGGNAATVTGLTVASGKTATVNNTLNFSGTDASTLNIGTGGTLGTAAYTASTAYLASGGTAANSSQLEGHAASYFATSTQGTTADNALPKAGITNASNATAGNIGEEIESKVPSGSAISLSSSTAGNVTSISLTAGDWDVQGNINWYSGLGVATATADISVTSATLSTDGSEVTTQMSTGTTKFNTTIPRKRINVSSSTTVYLVAGGSYTSGVTAYGSITARRVR